MAKKAAETGAGPTVAVAVEQRFPEKSRLIHDDLAGRILPRGMKVYVAITRLAWIRDWLVKFSESRAPGTWAMVPCRKRYIEDKVVEAVPDRVESVVNLGVGFDTLAYRLPELHGVPVWELDQPEIIDAKRSQLEKALGAIPEHVHLVSIDFDHQGIAEALASRGFAADEPSFFILEGVTQYLTESGARRTFEFLGGAPDGSHLVFTYVRQDFLDGLARYGQEFLYEQMLVKDDVWRFGLDPAGVADFLRGYGWSVVEHLGYDDLAERYVKPTGRELQSLAIERLVYAEKA